MMSMKDMLLTVNMVDIQDMGTTNLIRDMKVIRVTEIIPITMQ
jgi:hypothetical protein